MPREVGWKPRRNQQIDWLPVARRPVEQPPCGCLREQFRLRLRSKRDGDFLDLEPPRTQLLDQGVDVHFRPAADEGYLRLGDDDATDLRVHAAGCSLLSSCSGSVLSSKFEVRRSAFAVQSLEFEVRSSEFEHTTSQP